jgi:hypothetical protein
VLDIAKWSPASPAKDPLGVMAESNFDPEISRLRNTFVMSLELVPRNPVNPLLLSFEQDPQTEVLLARQHLTSRYYC